MSEAVRGFMIRILQWVLKLRHASEGTKRAHRYSPEVPTKPFVGSEKQAAIRR
jgi:hypothetical protein